MYEKFYFRFGASRNCRQRGHLRPVPRFPLVQVERKLLDVTRAATKQSVRDTERILKNKTLDDAYKPLSLSLSVLLRRISLFSHAARGFPLAPTFWQIPFGRRPRPGSPGIRCFPFALEGKPSNRIPLQA